ANLDVVLGAVLKETLHTRARVLGTLALVTMRQEKHEARKPVPLVLARRDELINDDLRAVQEIAELRLPDDERIRRVERITELESEHASLAERAVVNV